MLERERIANTEDAFTVDMKRLSELTSYSEKGSIQLNNLVKDWKQKQINAVRRLEEERAILIKRRKEIELKKLEIHKEHRSDEASLGDKRLISIFEGDYDRKNRDIVEQDIVVQEKRVEVDAEFDTVKYWKLKAKQLEKWLEEKLQENIKLLETQASPVEELSQVLKRADNFLHFILENAPVVMGHQDNELRYRFLYNHFPSLSYEDIIGKTDLEIFNGSGVQEFYDFKKEVMECGRPAKREITFGTELFGTKIFLLYAEPVYDIAGDAIGVNHVGMDISDQVIRREKMAKLREQIAVEEDKKAELDNRRSDAKQSLAHDVRPLLTEVVNSAKILPISNLDQKQ
ncbi:histidine kinase 5-like isoform X1 [Papaver somniferum]|uniref:histidine kinase 5-like isoform X1 n=1 Tax=Papaver somniferum TaxID=3469 RepID=UPI000E6F7427|nr:histidine kinase 5-like isoform X1 [Papaver somniferum]XP_026460363.1 histidine kinase 5-like isoform X1 [Papaver somniferum]XP_026460364.1 histidine kinase 5-like isoform X1 [Papaver somniferum]XP_026460365.1 histidine kinase 5-like isoform X1 [Papaver somniferum]